MPLCKIYNSNDEMICSFQLEDNRFNGKVTVGRSSKNSIVVSEEQGADKSVKDVHFAIIEMGKGKWRISAAGEDCLLESNGESFREVDLKDRLSLQFGNCMIKFEDNEQKDEPYHIIIETEKGKFISRPLNFGVNILGSAPQSSIFIPENTAWEDEHVALNLRKDGKITLEDLGSENGTFVKSKRIFKETACEKGETFIIGCTNACVVDRKNLNAILSMRNPFKASSAKWYKASLFSFIIIIILTIAILVQPQKKYEHISKDNKLSIEKETNLQILEQQAWLAVSEGYPEYAINLLSPSRLKNIKTDKLSATIKLIEQERNSLDHLLFFESQIVDFNFDKIEDKIIEAFAKNGPSANVLSHNIEYLKTAMNVIEKDKSLIDKTNSNLLKKNSYFLKKMEPVKKKIHKISDFLRYLLKINKLWNNKKWDQLNIFLEKENELHVKKTEKFTEFIKNLKEISNFAIKIARSKDELEKKDFFNSSFTKFRNDLISIKKQDESLKKLELYKQKDFAAAIGALSDLLDQLDALKAKYKTWEDHPESLELAQNLDSKLDEASLLLPVPPVIANAKPVIEGKMFEFLSSSMSNFNPPENRLGISQIKEKIKYCELIDLKKTKKIHKKLEKMLAQSYANVLKKCNLAYAEYTSLRENGDLISARKKLAEIQAAAPDGSRFKKWADDELASLKADKKKKAVEP